MCVSVDTQDETVKYVLKLLNNQKDPERRARMYREVAALRTLFHPNVPKYVDGNTDEFENPDVLLYFVTHYIPGSTLEERINERHLTIDEALSLIFILFEVLEYSHTRGIIHRDIKPGNIILRDNLLTDPVLIDFGLTFNWEENGNEQITEVDQHLGNRFMLLPELRGEPDDKRDTRSDLTACCGILLYVLTGIQPTTLLDGRGNKPHQRIKIKNMLKQIEPYRLELLNYLFDIAFETRLDYRWQSIPALRDKLLEIQQATMESTRGENPEAKIQRIREKVQSRAGYTQTLKVHEILNTIDRLLNQAHRETLAALGSDFTNHQGGYKMDVTNSQFCNTLGIIESTNYDKGFKPRFEAKITGSELVVIARALDKTTSLFREPISRPIPWEVLKMRVKDYFLSGVEQLL